MIRAGLCVIDRVGVLLFDLAEYLADLQLADLPLDLRDRPVQQILSVRSRDTLRLRLAEACGHVGVRGDGDRISVLEGGGHAGVDADLLIDSTFALGLA